MLTSSEKKDYILRMIEQIRKMVEAMMGLTRGGRPEEALAASRDAVSQLLGPLAGLAPRLDSATAAHMVGDADVVGAWAAVTAAEADAHRARGDEVSAQAAYRRSLELALESHLRTITDVPELLALIERLRPEVDAAVLDPRQRDALAQLPAPAEGAPD